MKAILITTANQTRLAQQWNVEPDDMDDRLPIGYWLGADFGSKTFDTLTPELFEEHYQIAGSIKNGYVRTIDKED